jgi:CRP-like cAMP-binding protein
MIELFDKFSFKSDLIFKGLSDNEKKMFLDLCEDKTFKKDNVLFYEKGIPTGIYFIQSGFVKKYTRGLGSKEQLVYLYRKYDLFGYHALLCDERYQDSCQAMTSINVKFISKENFFLLYNRIPAFQNAIIKNVSHEFGVLINTIALIAQKNLKNRLIIFLLILNNRFEDKGINMSREDLANLVGTTKESLGRTLKELKDKGYIQISSKIIHIKNNNELYNVVLRQTELTGHVIE